MRKDPLANGEIYHVLSRTIAQYKVFRSAYNCARFLDTIKFYQYKHPGVRFSYLSTLSRVRREELINSHKDDPLVQIIAYCIMPTHIHFMLKQLRDNGISIFMKHSLDSFTRYYNLKNKRKGPLWESRFKNILVESDEQLLHLTRYIHLNPVSAGLIDDAEEWSYSSYNEYLDRVLPRDRICVWNDLIDMSPKQYRQFVNDRKAYQREISIIKSKTIESYSD